MSDQGSLAISWQPAASSMQRMVQLSLGPRLTTDPRRWNMLRTPQGRHRRPQTTIVLLRPFHRQERQEAQRWNRLMLPARLTERIA
jgi:hypothetical protein